MVVELNVIGRLLLSELLLAVALPFMTLVAGNKRIGPIGRQFYLFAALWFLGALVTDFIRQTPFEDLARGWSKIFFFVLNFTSIYLLVNGKRQRIVGFICLAFVASAIRLRMNIDDAGIGDEVFGAGWKFGYGQLVAAASFSLSAILVANPITRLAGLSLPFVDAAINLALNARNMFGLTVLSGLVFALTAGRRRALSPTFLAIIGISGVVAIWATVSVYGYAASSGLMGVEAKEKYDFQTSGGLGVLLGGRSEAIASTQAIIDSPIVGHGSWARDIHYVELMVTRLEQAGYDMSRGDPFVDDLIPSHSHLFGAWVEAGILGAAFWLWAGWVTIRGLQAAIIQPTPWTGFIVFIGLSLLWDILFSPFGLERRVVTPAWIVLMISIVESSEGVGNDARR